MLFTLTSTGAEPTEHQVQPKKWEGHANILQATKAFESIVFSVTALWTIVNATMKCQIRKLQKIHHEAQQNSQCHHLALKMEPEPCPAPSYMPTPSPPSD